MEQLMITLAGFAPMSPELMQLIRSLLEPPLDFPAGELILREGEVSRFVSFILSGLVRSFHLWEGKEYTTWFNFEGDFFYSVQSFDKRQSSKQSIITMEPTRIIRISYDNLLQVYQKHPEFLRHRGDITQKYYEMADNIMHALRLKRPELMYEFIEEHMPSLMSRVNAQYVASFMNCHPRTLTRIRNEFRKRNRKH